MIERARQLGRTPSNPERMKKALRLERYLNLAKLPTIPTLADWAKPIQGWRVAGNDDWGDCVFAAKSHMIRTWSANKGREVVIPDQDVIDLYRHYSPGDNGYNILDSLDILRQKGMWGHEIWAYVAVDLQNHDLVRAAIYLFGGIDTGVNLPRGWQGDVAVWDIGAGRPGGWGGHDVWIPKCDQSQLSCITWGDVQPLTWAALDYYFDEGYACISPDWLAPGGVAPNGLDLPALHADLNEVTA